MKKLLTILPLIVFFLTSCKKDKDNSDPACTTSVASLAGSYKLTSSMYQPDASTPAEEDLLLYDDCQKDDLYVLNADGSGKWDDVGDVCSPDGSENFTWTLSGSTVTVSTDPADNISIQSFDCHTLIMKFTYGEEIYTDTYVKQ